MRPEGHNLVICGPNGSGKSSILDAIDFLLTGQISRLVGRGTGGITLQEHGINLNAANSPENAFVSGRFQLHDSTVVELQRFVTNSNELSCGTYDPDAMKLLLRLASNGQHILTRQRILQYVTEQPKDRAEKIQALLGLSNLENIRSSLVRVKNNLEKDFDKAEASYQIIRGQIGALLEALNWTDEDILIFVNKQRRILGGTPIESLASQNVRQDLSFGLRQESSEFVNPTTLETDMSNLRRVGSNEWRTKLQASDRVLRVTIGTINAEPRLLHELAHQQLVDQGLKLLDDTGICPLCQTAFPVGELRRKLETRLVAAQEASRLKEQVDDAARDIVTIIDFLLPSLNRALAASEQTHALIAGSSLADWQRHLEILRQSLKQPIQDYLQIDDQVASLFAPSDLDVILAHLGTAISTTFPQSSPEQTAYDRLTQIENLLKAWNAELLKHRAAETAKQYGLMLYKTFLEARDKILGNLYSEIRQRFEELYRQLHGPDEATFVSLLEPDDAGLNFKVDFHGKGMHPPHALHSEGHQDSMGICLFLALAERLAKGKFDMTLLDDVVMSVDSGHRKDLCRVLKEEFRDRQFIIATHDEVWARHLKSTGVVESSNIIELYSWDLLSGPSSDYKHDVWEQIEADLVRNDVPSASGKLRRWAEAFFRDACDNLAASVVFRSAGTYTLGDFMPAANAKWLKWLVEAKNAAKSYGDDKHDKLVSELEADELSFKALRKQISEEDWVVNATVHYNPWTNLHVNEFRPIVQAFMKLNTLYICTQCKGTLHVNPRINPESIRCNCGMKIWNLAKKKP